MNKILISLALVSSFASTLHGQRSISLEEAAHSALTDNRDLRAARESLKQAESRLTQARLRPNPTLDVSGGTDVVFSNEGDNSLSISVSQTLELGGKRAKRASVEELSVELTKALIADAERQLIGRLRTIFLEGFTASARLQMFDHIEQLNQQMTTVMDVRLRSGDASKLDSQLLLAQTNQIRAQRLTAQRELDAAMVQIGSLAGYSSTAGLTLKPIASEEFTGTEEAAITSALRNRPDLKAARIRESLEEAGVVLAKSQAVPNATLSVGYGRESFPALAAGASQQVFQHENVLQIGVSLPLPFHNREQGNIAEAVSRQGQARLEREALETTIRREVSLAFRRYESARETSEFLTAGVVQPNQEAARIIQLAYSLGDMRLLDVIAQQRIVIDAEASYLDAAAERGGALANLRLAMGE